MCVFQSIYFASDFVTTWFIHFNTKHPRTVSFTVYFSLPLNPNLAQTQCSVMYSHQHYPVESVQPISLNAKCFPGTDTLSDPSCLLSCYTQTLNKQHEHVNDVFISLQNNCYCFKESTSWHSGETHRCALSPEYVTFCRCLSTQQYMYTTLHLPNNTFTQHYIYTAIHLHNNTFTQTQR